MGLEGKYPVVSAEDEAPFLTYDIDGNVVRSTTGVHATCLLTSPGGQRWFRTPSRRDDAGNIAPFEYIADDARVRQEGTKPYLIPEGLTFSPARFVLSYFGTNSGWKSFLRPRLVADLTGDGRADLVGFADEGVLVSLNDGTGGFRPVTKVVENFGRAGGWNVDAHLRFVVDVTGDGRADIVGFGDDGVWVARNNGNGSFAPATFVLAAFTIGAGGWSVAHHPRVLAKLTGAHARGIVGFGDDGVWVSNGDGHGGFEAPRFVLALFGRNNGWSTHDHLRTVADLTGDGTDDIVGIADDGVWVALNDGAGNFMEPKLVSSDFGADSGFSPVHPHYVADVTGNGRADIVGFSHLGVRVAYGRGDGTFHPAELLIPWFGTATDPTGAVEWRSDRHPRLLADLTGNGASDIVAFGDEGTWVAVFDADGPIAPQWELPEFGYAAGNWDPFDHPRFVADCTGDGRGDIIGFGDDGVWVALNQGAGRSPTAPPA